MAYGDGIGMRFEMEVDEKDGRNWGKGGMRDAGCGMRDAGRGEVTPIVNMLFADHGGS